MAQFDVIVIGAGHAGCEAALAAARAGARVAVLTLRMEGIGQMSCNPAVGGVGKGHLVREIDALGGAMGQVADATGTQFRRLNASRGPAVRSTRVGVDAARYKEAMAARLRGHPNVTVGEGEAVAFCFDRAGALRGVQDARGQTLSAPAVIVTTGTFLRANCHVGDEQRAGGRAGDRASGPLSTALRGLGLQLGRFKTGTTPRLAAESIHWSVLARQDGEIPQPRFAFDAVPNRLPQLACALTSTTPETHRWVRDNLPRSPLYRGIITGSGPRYCPSLEDKVVRFAQRSAHQVFLEPEGLTSDRVYPGGLSTSLPRDAQEGFLRTIAGLEDCRVLQYGYAVEYDYVWPTQLTLGLMVKRQPGLFLAGQINGSSGYEEAAAQGLMAGINAVRWLAGAPAAVLGREEGYIGVLIDDLVTRGVDEPYRIFTSRAEHRLTLREGSAEARLTARAHAWHLVDDARLARAHAREAERHQLRQSLGTTLGAAGARRLGLCANPYAGKTCEELLRRPDLLVGAVLVAAGLAGDACERLQAEEVAEEVRYAGYIARETRHIARLKEMEEATLAADLDYDAIDGLSGEARQKLAEVGPRTLGQAGRIPGITPSALGLLSLHSRRVSRAQGRPHVSRAP